MRTGPSYDAIGLVNLMAEIEFRLIGSAPSPRLEPTIAAEIPEGPSIVLVLFDGLGMAQVESDPGVPLRQAVRATLQAGFPTTTSASLATVATGLPPGGHGVIAHLSWFPEHGRIVNTLKWVDLAGQAVARDHSALLPAPNLWERVRESGIEPITVQPADFARTPLSRALYRGARFEGAWDVGDLIEATAQLAAEPGRLIFTYVPQVDFAGHVHGLASPEFEEAMGVGVRVWDELARRLPLDTVLVGTADHGLIEYAEPDKVLIRDPRFDGLRIGGDPRALHLWCGEALAGSLAEIAGGELVDPTPLLGAPIGETARDRIGEFLLLAPRGKVLLPRGFDKRLRAYHGGLEPEELEIPLLVR